MVDLYQMASDIACNPVLIDQKALIKASKVDMKAKSLLNSLSGKNKPILYDVWGSKTGRLTTKQGSFPIMNLKKEIANCVVPKNDIFVQFDLNGAEIRTFISLSTGTHPRVDIHEWNMENVLTNITDRNKAKVKFLSWFYISFGVSQTRYKTLFGLNSFQARIDSANYFVAITIVSFLA